MGETSKIEWTDATFNPWIGCTKLSAACDNCYAEKERAVTCLGVTWGAGQPRHRTSASTWKQPLTWNRKAAKEGRRMRVFCASLADVFDAEVPDDWRDDLFALIAATPHLDWLLLTKRPKVMRDFADRAARCGEHWLADKGAPPVRWPLPNVWLGTTVENQAMAEARIPHLLGTPAAVRFLSMEPLLGMVDLRRWMADLCPNCLQPGCVPSLRFDSAEVFSICGRFVMETPRPLIDWVITGGESGPKARPSRTDWFRAIRDQCAADGVAFLHKQNGEWLQCRTHDPGAVAVQRDGTITASTKPLATVAQDMGMLWMERVGKKAAGRLLDGVLHDALPAVRS
ncbi:phage Gp37/Gp68 family protein [Azospirillum brasilense]|uniref:Phage Gp37/Gp68 family protein n=1 Tax=Azospirillum brasilense TaxID=192 RepID=A0A4D8QSZ0_AZOBR|nr:phage Gp37/Gp68 family protein [Azospirillum brasilense]QCO14025.1 phage Gp37/Gp68 family protein [Azospirillum brasilense]